MHTERVITKCTCVGLVRGAHFGGCPMVMNNGMVLNDLENAVDRATGKRPIYTKEPRMPIMVYVSPDLHDRVAQTAKECGTNLAAVCRQAITAYLDELDGAAQ